MHDHQNAVRIGNAHGFWGDRLEAAAEMLTREPDLDFITLDFLAEVSMSILAAQRRRDPQAGYARDFLDVVDSLAPYWQNGGKCRLIANAGGLNPQACAEECRRRLRSAGCSRLNIAAVVGDDVLPVLHDDLNKGRALDGWKNLDTDEAIATIADRVQTANAYIGAQGIAEALDKGADIVIAGRVADPSLTVGPCVHRFGWEWNDWDRLAGATVAGHLIECGAQACGGIATDWLSVPGNDRIGFPIVEVDPSGVCVVRKPAGSGGRVTESVVKEQLLYEIGDPSAYLSPDVAVSFLDLQVRQIAENRVRVSGAKGRPAPSTLKVSATWLRGYRAAGSLTVFGADAVRKAVRAGEAVLDRLRRAGFDFRESVVECIGSGACFPVFQPQPALTETVLRIAVADDAKESVEAFTRAMTPLITAGPQGTTGYSEGRPRVHPHVGFWPCLIDRARVDARVVMLDGQEDPAESLSPPERSLPLDLPNAAEVSSAPPQTAAAFPPGSLGEIAHGRSGDKGRNANVGVIARRPEDFDTLKSTLTIERVAESFGLPADRVRRYELPNLKALNFVLEGVLENTLRLDSQGKTLAQALLLMPR